MADFVAVLDRINAVAHAAAGFVWRLQTDERNASAIRPVDDEELLAINMSVWESVEALADYVYQSEHVDFMRRRREWFERYGTSYLGLPPARPPSPEDQHNRIDRAPSTAGEHRAPPTRRRDHNRAVDSERPDGISMSYSAATGEAA